MKETANLILEAVLVLVVLIVAVLYFIWVMPRPAGGQEMPTRPPISIKHWLYPIVLFFLVALASLTCHSVAFRENHPVNGKLVAAGDLLTMFNLYLGDGCSVSYLFFVHLKRCAKPDL